MYEGAGLGPDDVDIFNPYDGYAPMAQFFLEAFQWHGVKRGDAFAFYAGDIRVEGPHPFCSSGGNLGNRAHPYGHVHRQHRAAPRHGRRPAGQGSGRETALAAFTTPSRPAAGHVRQTPELTAVTGESTGSRRPLRVNLTGAGGGPRFPIEEQRSPMPDELRKAEVIETTIGKLAEAAAELARRGLAPTTG